MARYRVSLAYIPNDNARKTTFKKRKKGLLKKVSELTTLCGIQACVVVLSSYESKPETWPDLRGAQQVIARFEKILAVDERKNLNQESFTRQRIAKINAQLDKHRAENAKKETTLAMFRCVEGKCVDNKMVLDLEAIDRMAQESINYLNRKINEFI